MFSKFSFEAIKKEFGNKLASCPQLPKTITLVKVDILVDIT